MQMIVAHRAKWTVIAGALAFAPLPAAAELDATVLQTQAQEMVDAFVAKTGGELKPKGTVEATRDGDAVVLTIPGFDVGGDGPTLDVPPIEVRLDELDADRVAFAVTLPTEITGVRPPPAPDTLTMTIGAQDVAGVYHRKIASYESLRASLGDISLVTGDGGFDIGQINLNGDSVESGPTRWSQNLSFALDRLRVFGPDNSTMVEIARIEQEMGAEDLDLPTYMEITQKLTGGLTVDPASAETPEHKAAMLDMVERMPAALKGASAGFGFRLEGVKVAAISGPPVDLGAASFAIEAAPVDEFYEIGMELAVHEPEVAMPGMGELVPDRLLAEVSLRRMPFAALFDMMRDPLVQELKGDPSGQAADQLEMAPMAAMGAAAEAGSFVEVNTLEIDLGPAKLTASGVGPMAPGLPEPALRVEGAISGLEALVEQIQAMEPGFKEEALAVALVLRGLGKAESRNGEIVHTYLVEQGPNGPADILINGVSIDEIGPPQ